MQAELLARRAKHFQEEALDELKVLLPARLARVDPKINLVENTQIQMWVGMWPEVRKGLYIYGDYGVGKTYAAAAILGSVASTTQEQVRMAWVPVSAFLKDLRKTYSDGGESGVWKELEADIVVLDDLKEPGTEWQKETLGQVIEHLYDHDMLCLVTGNQPPKELWPRLGPHIRSRLHEMLAPVKMEGMDRRMEPLPPRTPTRSGGSS